ncbi:MAG: hypothetical protein IJO87_06510 [Eggerthellaceae bacterium]|nr:hypothetical protein [Eggerthellaceae bacterium]
MSQSLSQLAASAAESPDVLSSVIGTLVEGKRRERQKAASVAALVSAERPEALQPHIADLVGVLEVPESQTRWEVLDALTRLVQFDSRACEKGLVGAEASLFDEDSGPARLAAMKFLCKVGSTTEARSEKVWPLIDEAIQCYHGDLEFQDMLIALIEFSEGKLSAEVKAQLGARMGFDARNARGPLGKRAKIIVENVTRA